MKTFAQIIETQVHKAARQKIRTATQPGIILNVIDSEINTLLTEVINQRLCQEQEQLLQRAPYQRIDNIRYRNGFKSVKIKGFVKALFVRKPVLRSKTPPSKIIGTLRRFGSSLLAALGSRFWLRGSSTRATAQELNETFGTNLSASDISQFTKELLPDIHAWLSKPIPSDIAYLFLDAIYLPVRKPGFTTKQALLVALGISSSGKRHILGFLLGDRENIDSWSNMLKDLLKRGLNRSALLLAVSDEHKAIVSAVEQTLGIEHQLCIVHKMRNALARVSSKHRRDFYADFTSAFWAASKNDAIFALGQLQAKWISLYPKAVQITTANTDAFLKFFDQPKHLWTVLRSTNIIERFNRELRRRLRPAGAMQSENELWKLVWSVSNHQEERWNKHKIHVFKELKQAA
jgi:putative transposase